MIICQFNRVEWCDGLGGGYADELVSLVVSGKENPEQSLDIVDMLEEVMTDKEPVNLQRNQRTIADHQRHFAIDQVYQRKLLVLNRILRDE
ncbi:MAG: hypothetical protein FPO08_16180 [Geobacter sp.]|nr:MAG: hypothetical protein FPO08_16180 [Geobacter sp.]